MVYGACYCPLNKESVLVSCGVAGKGREVSRKVLTSTDSKTLDEAEREDRFEKLKSSDVVGHILVILGPEELSNKMLRKFVSIRVYSFSFFCRVKYNLNMISHDAAASLIRQALDRGVNLQKVRFCACCFCCSVSALF